MRKLCDKDGGENHINNEVAQRKVIKVSTRNSLKNVLIEIQCAMPLNPRPAGEGGPKALPLWFFANSS